MRVGACLGKYVYQYCIIIIRFSTCSINTGFLQDFLIKFKTYIKDEKVAKNHSNKIIFKVKKYLILSVTPELSHLISVLQTD